MTERPSSVDDRSSAPSEGLTITQALRIVILGFLVIGCFVVLRPFLSALMWSVILCSSSWPLYARLLAVFRGRHTLAALAMTLAIVLVLLVPFAVIGLSLADDVRSFMAAAQRVLVSPPPEPPSLISDIPLIGTRAAEAWHRLVSDSSWLSSQVRRVLEPVTGWLLSASLALFSGLLEMAISIFICFFLFRDGAVAASRFTQTMGHIAGERAGRLVQLAGNTVRGVVYGVLGTALAQAIVAGIGFAIVRVPGGAFLALATFFLAVLPVGPPLIWISVVIWLFLKGSTGWAIFMIVWGLLISSVDNVIKPLIISQGSRMPFIMIFLGILGGAAAFGFIGVFLGPTLLAVGFSLLDQWNSVIIAPSESETRKAQEHPPVVS